MNSENNTNPSFDTVTRIGMHRKEEKLTQSKTAKVRVFTGAPLDKPMLIIILLLVAFGSVMVFSASYAYAFSRYGDSTYFIKKQLLWVAIGLVAMLFVSHIYYKMIKVFSLPIYGVALVLLGLVLVIGVAAQSAQRWIYIGPFSLQPSEIMKFALVLAMAWYGDVYKKKIHDPTLDFKHKTLNTLIKPAAFIAVAAGAIMLENHVSGTLIVCLIGAICLWALGCDKKWFIILGSAAFMLVGVILLIVWFKDASWNKIDDIIPAYVVKRIDMWLRPENYTLLDDTWQTVQGKYAVGSGGFFGAGFGQSYQKHLFVSQPQNDFIFAIVCEELGFVGAVGLIALYLVFVYRGLVIARRAPDVYSSIVATGIVGHVGIQAFLNMLVVTGVFPNTGISLPFISYGGSSLVMLMAEMGILLSISRASSLEK